MSSWKKISLLSIGSVSGVVAATGVASAQTSGGIEDIVVTAQKIEQNVNDVGMSITALSGEQLLKTGIKGPEDLSKAVPGFNFSKSAYGTPVFTLRGIGFYSLIANASPAVGVYLDETPLPYSYMTRGVGQDVQRVEVLKGPQGTLFGQNATGGAINYIANRPTDDFRAGADLEYGSYDQLTASGFISGPISGTLKARLSASTERGGAWQKSFTRDEKNGEARFYSGRLLVDWNPTSDLSLQFNVNGWIDNSDEQAAQPLAILPSRRPAVPQALRDAFNAYPVPTSARWADWDPGVPFGAALPYGRTRHDGYRRDNDFLQLSLRGDYHLGDLTLTSITAWSKLNQRTMLDTDGMSINNTNIASDAKIKSFSQELRLSGRAGSLRWMIGGNYARDTTNIYGGIFSQFGTFPFPTSDSLSNSRINTYAAFANLDYGLTETLSVNAGIRYTDVRISNEGCTADGGDGIFSRFVTRIAAMRGVSIAPPPGGCITLDPVTFQPGMVHGELNQDNVPFKLGLNWKAGPDALLYANLSRGYKAGSFTPAGAVFAPSLDPAVQESVVAYEVGFKLGLGDRRVQLNGAVFRYDYKDKQVQGKLTDPVVGTLNKLINIPKSRVTGAELQLTWVPDDHWRLNAGGSYIDSEIRDNFTNNTASGVEVNMGGQVLPYTPRWQLMGDAEYSLPVGQDIEAFAGASTKYQSASFAGLGEEALFRIDGYANLDLRAGARAEDDRWSVTLFVNNVTNKYSWNFVGLTGNDVISRLANRPRTFGVKLSLRH